MSDTIRVEAVGEFPFTFYIEKAQAEETEKELILAGVASTTNIDHDNERMSKEALQAMANIINTTGVPLRVEHSKSDNAVIGSVYNATLDERNQLQIKARLDKNHPVSPLLYHSIKALGKKMGFSVGGLVKHAMREFSESTGKLVKTFYDVELKEVSVTPRPANFDAWAIAKSIASNESEADKIRPMFHDEFLYENPKMDYLQVFAKSVPDEAWRRVKSLTDKDTNMSKEQDVVKTGADETSEETEKAVTRQEFKAVTKAVETIAESLKSFAEKVSGKFGKAVVSDTGAKDQVAPDKKKPEDESATAKSADETTEEATKANDSDAKDQTNPDKKKPEDESSTAKAASEADETSEKAAKPKEDEYDMETVTRCIERVDAVTKAMDETTDEEATKAAEETTEDEATKAADEAEMTDETSKSVHPLDQFVVTVTKAIEKMSDKFSTKGYNVVGFTKHMVDQIKSDPKMQEEIAKMMKVPGKKQSMAFGTAYMTTKDGKRFALSATEVGAEVSKSRDASKGGSFKEVYKSSYSTVREDAE